MSLSLREVELDKDYPKLKSWWEKRSFPPANIQFIPPTGIMVSSDEEDICAGFLFKSDANAAIIGNIVSNPEIDRELRSEALDTLISTLTGLAKHEGYRMVCCSTNLPHVMKRFETLGFSKTDTGVSNFGRVF